MEISDIIIRLKYIKLCLNFSQIEMHLKFQLIHRFFYWVFFYHSLFFSIYRLQKWTQNTHFDTFPQKRHLIFILFYYLYVDLITKKEYKKDRERKRKMNLYAYQHALLKLKVTNRFHLETLDEKMVPNKTIG